MKRRGVVVLGLIAVVVVAFFAIRIIDSTRDNRRRQELITAAVFDGIVAEFKGDESCEVLVDFGLVPYSKTATKTIRITNTTDSPLVFVDYTTQCRCMWLEFDREPIDVGESKDVVLYFDSRGEWGSVGNYMEIKTSHDLSPVVLWIGAEIE